MGAERVYWGLAAVAVALLAGAAVGRCSATPGRILSDGEEALADVRLLQRAALDVCMENWQSCTDALGRIGTVEAADLDTCRKVWKESRLRGK